MQGLSPDGVYTLQSREQSLRIGQFAGLVKHIAPVSLNPNGPVLRMADRHFTLPDGGQSATLSGAALMAGIPLLPAFRGTGYDPGQRTQSDFGSNVYVIKRQ